MVIVASACGSEVESADSAVISDVTVTIAEASVESVMQEEVESTTTTVVPEPLLTGREAIAAAEGTPHVLWFWGAH